VRSLEQVSTVTDGGWVVRWWPYQCRLSVLGLGCPYP